MYTSNQKEIVGILRRDEVLGEFEIAQHILKARGTERDSEQTT